MCHSLSDLCRILEQASFVGCTAEDPANPVDECDDVGQTCPNSQTNEYCCLDDCPRNYCTSKPANPEAGTVVPAPEQPECLPVDIVVGNNGSPANIKWTLANVNEEPVDEGPEEYFGAYDWKTYTTCLLEGDYEIAFLSQTGMSFYSLTSGGELIVSGGKSDGDIYVPFSLPREVED